MQKSKQPEFACSLARLNACSSSFSVAIKSNYLNTKVLTTLLLSSLQINKFDKKLSHNYESEKLEAAVGGGGCDAYTREGLNEDLH